MANTEHLEILKKGVDTWNSWRYSNKSVLPDLSGADLSNEFLKGINLKQVNLRNAILVDTMLPDANLTEANLQQANMRNIILEKANLREADLSGTDLTGGTLIDANLPNTNLSNATLSSTLFRDANLSEANLYRSILIKADLTNTDLTEANLEEANLESANLTNADLSKANCKGANLRSVFLVSAKLYWTDFSGATLCDSSLPLASLLETNLENADLSRCWIYGVSVWNPNLKGTIQRDLIITSSHADKSTITVDNLEIAQFIYLITRNEKIRSVVDTIGKKAVLILGRFTLERIAVLDAIREELRKRNYIPILFDFEEPDSRNLTETVVTLAHLSRFVIVDLTDPRSVPHELMGFAPNLPSVAVQPIISKGHKPYAMFEHLQNYPWVLPIYEYETQDQLIADLNQKIIKPAEIKVTEIRPTP